MEFMTDSKTINAYKKLGKKYIKNIESYLTQELKEFAELLESGDSVLDVGCAGGRDSKYLSDRGFKVTGIDLVDEFLESAVKYAPKAKFINMDMCALSFPDNSFDGIWAAAVLLHLKRQEVSKAIKNFYRVLKPGGILFVGVKKGEGYKTVVDSLSDGVERYFTYFSQEEVNDVLRDSGFKIVSSNICRDEASRGDVEWIRTIAKKRRED